MTYSIRPADVHDAEAVSRVIGETVRISNAADYPPEVIETVVSDSSPGDIRRLFVGGTFFVAVGEAEEDDGIVGVAGLVEDRVRRFFVLPECQGAGIGRALLEAVEAAARMDRLPLLRVNSSLTAVGFYRRHGYAIEAEGCLNGTRFVKMTKPLPAL